MRKRWLWAVLAGALPAPAIGYAGAAALKNHAAAGCPLGCKDCPFGH